MTQQTLRLARPLKTGFSNVNIVSAFGQDCDCLILPPGFSFALNSEAKLIKKITEGYNPRVRPVLQQNDTVIVTLGMSLHQIMDLVGIELL